MLNGAGQTKNRASKYILKYEPTGIYYQSCLQACSYESNTVRPCKGGLRTYDTNHKIFKIGMSLYEYVCVGELSLLWN